MNWKNDDDVIICWSNVIVNFFDAAVIFLSSLGIDPSFMSVSLLVLELWEFLFTNNLSRNAETENNLFEFVQYLEAGASKGYQIWHKYLKLVVT